MLPEDEFPKVDVYICRYSEPVEILEATTVAALNMDYPGDKLSIYVCDDGKSPEVLAMCKRLRYQLRYMDRRANLFYVGRSKKEGVPHHAKAGNINNTLLMHSSEDVQYLMVLDCDMIVHPTFLHRTLSHFYVSDDNGGWRQKEFIGLLQTPQDFWNVDSRTRWCTVRAFSMGRCCRAATVVALARAAGLASFSSDPRWFPWVVSRMGRSRRTATRRCSFSAAASPTCS